MKKAHLCTPVVFSLFFPFSTTCASHHNGFPQESGQSQVKYENSSQLTENNRHSEYSRHHKGPWGKPDSRPNILFILADDLGYSDLEIDEYNNTIIMVVSDNGAEAIDPKATFPPYILIISRMCFWSFRLRGYPVFFPKHDILKECFS
ncbi:hypothetical protein [Desulfopila sp. IMCC35008]|uniref:hypothetical protein n=1 Tax=Desulfopila sp. IMCC35008 TaxID=2653858 RepID=UPI0013D35DAC|nr:hypothetical protein [Desulfopila sp. IMCC35008]